MLSEKQKFMKIWWVCFKYLFLVMVLVLLFRTGQLFYSNQADSVSLFSIFSGLLIAFFGIAFVCAIIAGYAVVQDRKYQDQEGESD